MDIRKIARLGLLTAIALAIHFLEAKLPPPVPIPGVRLGLANIVTVFAVFALRAKAGAQVLFARIFLGCVFGGNFGAILYAGAGGLLAILTTIALRPVLTRKQLWVAGSLGAAAHSVGQMIVAAAVTGTPTVLIYLPVLLICSVVTGIFTGLCAQFLVNRGGVPWKIFSK